MRQRGVQIGAPFKVPSYLVHPLVVPSIRFRTLVSNAYDAPSLCLAAGGMLPRFAQSLGGCSLASLSRFPFNVSIKLLQKLHSRRPTKQRFYVWEPCCGYLHKVKRANGAINMHSKGSNESLPKYLSTIWKNRLVPPCSILLPSQN